MLILTSFQVLLTKLKPTTGSRVSSFPRAHAFSLSTGPSSAIPSSTPSLRSSTPSDGWRLDGRRSRSR